MQYGQWIKEEFDNFVRRRVRQATLQSFLINHEKKPLLISNLTKQISDAEHIIFNIGDTQEDKRKTVRGLIEDLSNAFCVAALSAKEKEFKQKQESLLESLK